MSCTTINLQSKEKIMDLTAMNMVKRRSECQMTVLHRPGGVWDAGSVAKLVNTLMTEASQLPSQPEYLILFGHYTKAETLSASGGGLAFTATQVIGLQDKGLPFTPGFI